MNHHYDYYLTKKYAPLYKNRYLTESGSCMYRGFEVGDGWFNIINVLSQELCKPWLQKKQFYLKIKNKEGKLLKTNDVESQKNYLITKKMIEQSKKEMQDAEILVPMVRQVKEKLGGLRFYVSGANEEQRAIINFAETLSLSTCEVCGKKGKIGGKSQIATRCNKHKNTNDK
jgi:hypothetical protein